MRLTREEQGIADGDDGDAAALAMSIMTTLGERYDAPDMVPIAGAHIDGCIYRGDDEASLVFAETLAAGGARVKVPTTLSAGARDITRWREMRMTQEFADGCRRMEQAYLSMGTLPAWTCAPYLGDVPTLRYGQHVAWAESNAIVFANSVVGARTARYGDFSDICAALIGRVPRFDLHVDENRIGRILVNCDLSSEVDAADPGTYSAIGYAIGTLVPDGIPVIEGLPAELSIDQLKALCAATATSGNVAMLHIVGVTPEAATREQALGGLEPTRVERLDARAMADARSALSTMAAGTIDLVTIGCPHASLEELERIVVALDGRSVADGVEFWVKTNRSVYDRLEQTPMLDALRDAGVTLLTDACFFAGHYQDQWPFRRVVTNSAKYAHYAAPPGVRAKTLFRSTTDCVQAAVSGVVDG
jgi:predicted aconitase